MWSIGSLHIDRRMNLFYDRIDRVSSHRPSLKPTRPDVSFGAILALAGRATQLEMLGEISPALGAILVRISLRLRGGRNGQEASQVQG